MAGFTDAKAMSILTDSVKSTTYVGLSTTTPNNKGGNVNEPAPGTGYARVQIGPLDTSKTRQIANKEYIFIFECLETTENDAVSVILANGATDTPFFSADLTTSVPLVKGYVPLIRPYKLKIGLDKSTLESYTGELPD